jgi:hypothetical protein
MRTATQTANSNKWDPNEKANWLWVLLGFIGIGQLVALIYVLIKNDKNRLFALLFLLGWLGDLILYFVFKGKDERLSSIAIKLFLGEIAVIIIALIFIAVTGIGLFSLFTLLGPSSTPPHSGSSSLNSNYLNSTYTGPNPTWISDNGSSCGNFTLSLLSGAKTGSCFWSGGYLNMAYASGNSGYVTISIVGSNGNTYFRAGTIAGGYCDSDTSTVYVNLPAQTYTIKIRAGMGGGACGNAFVYLLS